jgi:LytS/YehU family sensor histidine kinase
VVLSLSGFLRSSLEKDPGEKTTLAAEIEAQRQYLAIEQIRFGDRLKLTEAASPETGRALVPSFILQPLVENAVKHGVARSTAPVRIEILAEAADGGLRITVQDDAVPDLNTEPVRLGVGLENVRKRLAVMYGEAGRITCGRREAGGFACVLELPLERR